MAGPISIHALLAESDKLVQDALYSVNISIHALLAESDVSADQFLGLQTSISIHALLAESDYSGLHFPLHAEISIHALLAESDRKFGFTHTAQELFLSTLSLRRATGGGFDVRSIGENFYPRSPCGERQRLGLLGWLRTLISIHALLAESDGKPRALKSRR